jgi:TetR/AcrR family tetracycline transcriptional repressor
MPRKPSAAHTAPASPATASAQAPATHPTATQRSNGSRTAATGTSKATPAAKAKTKTPATTNKPKASATATPRTASEPSGLTREAVLAAALAQIDERGVEAFSVRDLARTLGVYPTALYWHVPGRNALIAGAVAQALGELAPPDPGKPWQDELRALFTRYREAVRRHPRIAPVLGAQLVSNDSMNPLLVDHILALLEAAGFAGAQLANAYNVVIAAMVGFVTLELAPRPSDDPDGWAEAHARKLHATDPAAAPTLARHLPALADKAFIVRWSSGREQPLEAGFAAWCEVIVGGLEVLRNQHEKWL